MDPRPNLLQTDKIEPKGVYVDNPEVKTKTELIQRRLAQEREKMGKKQDVG